VDTSHVVNRLIIVDEVFGDDGQLRDVWNESLLATTTSSVKIESVSIGLSPFLSSGNEEASRVQKRPVHFQDSAERHADQQVARRDALLRVGDGHGRDAVRKNVRLAHDYGRWTCCERRKAVRVGLVLS